MLCDNISVRRLRVPDGLAENIFPIMTKQRIAAQAGFLAALDLGIAGIWALLPRSSGVLTYLWLTILLSCALLALRTLHLLIASLMFRRQPGLTAYGNFLLAFISAMLVVMAFESFLQFQAKHAGEGNARLLTMPKEWEERPVFVEGSVGAKYWHGKLHVYNEYGMRRTTPFTAKTPEIGRIMVLGDSLTYGKGVDANDTYPSLMERMLSQEFRVEVLNLGISGYQSQDILRLLLAAAPELKPDIIVYGVCLNDFLETGEGQESRENRRGWQIPLPLPAKQFFIKQTLFGQFLEKAYDDLLMRLGLRADFLSNILRGLHHYQLRFTRDVTIMDFFAENAGFPPIVAMTLDQFPEVNGRGQQVARIAETCLQLAGMDVIPTEEYYQTYNGKTFMVSEWEGHPNEEAHRLFAEAFVRRLRQHPALQPYKK